MRLFCICLLLSFLCPCMLLAEKGQKTLLEPSLSGQEIIDKVNETINQETAHGIMKMTITTTSGAKRTFIYDSYIKDRGEKSLIRYTKPKRVKDQAILMLNNADDIWAYFPRTRRVRKLATHAKRQKLQGSDFSYEDMGSGDAFIKDYDTRLIREERKGGYDCYIIEMMRKEKSYAGYSRMIMSVPKKYYFPVEIAYYDDDDPDILEKVLVVSEIKIIQGIPTGTRMTMQNIEDMSETSMEIVEIEYDVKLNDSIFSERNLKK